METIPARTTSVATGLAERLSAGMDRAVSGVRRTVGRLFGRAEDATIDDRPPVLLDRGLAEEGVDSWAFFDWAATETGRALDVPRSVIDGVLEAEWVARKETRPGGLAEELAAIVALIALSRSLGIDDVPVLAGQDRRAPESGSPIVDFTSRYVIRALGLDTRADPEEVAATLLRSGLVAFLRWETAAVGAFNLFTASLEIRLAQSAAPQTQGGAGLVSFTLETINDKLIVDRFYQSRYAPVQFGRSKFAMGALHAGAYGFQTFGTGNPPPQIDPAVHAVSAHHVKGYTSSF